MKKEPKTFAPCRVQAGSDGFGFLRQFIANPRAIGAIAPSSLALAHAMLAPVEFATAQAIVEFGPGTGAITRAIAPRLHPGCRYVGIEINASFCTRLRDAFPALDFVHGSVTDLSTILQAQGIGAIDAIVSGLPWAALPAALQEAVLPQAAARLRPGGVFVTFAYVHGLQLPAARALRAILRRHFTDVALSPVVWRNLPPALCYICKT